MLPGSSNGCQLRLFQHPADHSDVGQESQPVVVFTWASAARRKPPPGMSGLLPSVCNSHRCQGSLTRLIFEMALIVPALKPGLQFVESRPGHHQQQSRADGNDEVHSLSISRAISARSRNSYRFGTSVRRGRDDVCVETANIRRIDAANRRLMLSRRAGAAAAVPKSTSCSVISTAADDTPADNAAGGG